MSEGSDISYISEEDAYQLQRQQHPPGSHKDPARRPPRLSHASSLNSAVGDELLDISAQAWQEVDRQYLSETVLKLISSVAATAPTDDKSREAVVWHPTAVTPLTTHNLNDPLGFGKIDVVNLRLERPGAGGDVAAGHWQGAALSPSREAMAAARQGKGAVARFFSELTRGEQAAAAAAAGPPGSSPLLRTATLGGAGAAAVAAAAGGGGLLRQSSLGAPLPPSKLLPSEEGFDPEMYLAVFHGTSSASQLAAGVRALERELGESTGQLKQLVKQNFERFISCKTTIDDIYVKLQRIESTSTGISTEVLYNAIQQVQDGASDVFGPILDRSAKAERIRSVQLLLRRFSGLFSAPQRVRALGAARDYEQVTAEWKKANALIKPGPKTNKVWASLYAEIEQRVSEVYEQQSQEVQDPQLPAAAATELVGHMLQLQAEGLTLAQGDNPLSLLLAAREQQFAAAMQQVTSEHERAVARLKAAMAAAATDERMQDPAVITDSQMLRWQGSWDHETSTSSSSSSRPIIPKHGVVSPVGSPTAAAAASTAASGSSGSGGGGPAVFARALSSYRGAVPQAVGEAAVAALEAVTGSTSATAAAAVAAGGGSSGSGRGGGGGGVAGVLGLPGSKHLAELAPLSGLQPPAPRSRLVQHTKCTAGEELYLQHLERLSCVLLECLPGFWQAAGPTKLVLPANLPSSATTRLQQTLEGARDITARLVDKYCQAVGGLLQALAGVGPLRESLLAATEELATTLRQLEGQKAPSAAVRALRGVLGAAVASGVGQLVTHLQAVPAVLSTREGWQLSLTHSGDQPITLLPEQLQEEVTVAMQYYQQLLESSTGHVTGSSTPGTSSSSSSGEDSGGGISLAAATIKFISPDKCTKPIREAYFACLEDFVMKCMAATDHLRPAAAGGGKKGPAGEGGATGSDGSSKAGRRPAMSVAAAAAILGRESWEDTDVQAEGTFDVQVGDGAPTPAIAATAAVAAGGGAAAPAGHVLRLVLSDDVKLLLIGSNLSYLREKLVGSLTQRFLLVLTGENASELQRCSSAVRKLAGRLDNTIQAVHTIYVDRKKRAVDRLLAAYVQADGSPVGSPPDLKDISPQAQQLVRLVAAVQSETFTYARPFMQQLLHGILEHLGSALTTAFTGLPSAAGASAAAAGAGAGGGTTGSTAAGAAGCPVEALGQYFMDLVFLDATLSKAGPPSLSTDLTAAYHLLVRRICPPEGSSSSGSRSSARDRSSAETPLARSLLAIKDPRELNSKLQVTCRKALGGVLERSAFTLRSLLATPAAKG